MQLFLSCKGRESYLDKTDIVYNNDIAVSSVYRQALSMKWGCNFDNYYDEDRLSFEFGNEALIGVVAVNGMMILTNDQYKHEIRYIHF